MSAFMSTEILLSRNRCFCIGNEALTILRDILRDTSGLQQASIVIGTALCSVCVLHEFD